MKYISFGLLGLFGCWVALLFWSFSWTVLLAGIPIFLLLALAAYAHWRNESLKQALLNFELRGSVFETGLLEKIHALENGGHLAPGTTQQLVASQTGSRPAAS